MNLNVINLNHRTDRWASIGNQFTGYPLVRFNALTHPKGGWIGCAKSHGTLLEHLKKEDDSGMYTVIEDDCEILCSREEFDVRWKKYQEYLKAHQGEWDYFMGGGTYIVPQRIVSLDPFIIECDWGVCLQFVVHSARSAQTLIDYSKQSDWVDSCDTHLSSKHRGKIWVAYPMMVWQFQKDSDIASQEQIEDSRRNFENTKQCLDHFVKVITTKPAFTLTNPEVSLYKDFLTAEECQELIDGAKDRLTKSQVVNSETKENMDHHGRTSSGTYYTIGQTLLIEKIEQHISHITGMPIENGEGIQILKYEAHQEYLPHYDWFQGAHDNQRVATFIMYLNTPIEGGQTVFPNANISVNAQMGSGLLFKYPNQDINSLHGGSPVLQGEKWIATKWIRKERL